MKSIKLICLILVFMFIAVGCAEKLAKPPEPTNPTEPTKPLRKAAFDGDLEKQKHSQPQPQSTKRIDKYIYKQTPQGELAIHVHFPKDWTANDKRPAIVFFFGGGWKTGTVKEFVPQAEYLSGRGMVTARADYRVKSRHGTTPDKCVEDAKSTVRWLRANAAKLGIDPNRIVASGYSAGGHVAACTYTTKGLEAEGENLSVSSKPNLLVLFNAILDFAPYYPRLRSKEMAIKISPCHNLTKDVPPTILFYGTEDMLILDGIDFIEKSKKLGTYAELYTAEGQAHESVLKSPWRKRTIYLMGQFLARHGYTQDEPTMRPLEGEFEMNKMSPINLSAYVKDRWGHTPLHRTARHANKKLVELLISKGAEVNAKDKWDYTPLHYAAAGGHKDVAELLIDKGAYVNAKDRGGSTPLHHAALSGHKEVAELLIDKGADIEAKIAHEAGAWTPFFFAANFGFKNVAELLLDRGADMNVRDIYNDTLLHSASWNGHKDVVEFLIAKGADVKAKDNFGRTPLHVAARPGHRSVVELLVDKGADVNAKNKWGQTPLDIAVDRGHTEIADLLRKHGAKE